MDFCQTSAMVDALLEGGKKMAKGRTLAEAGIPKEYMESYGEIAERTERDRNYGLSRYPYERVPGTAAFDGGFFDNQDWTLKRALEKQPSMRSVYEYECKYINAAGYWAAFQESAFGLRKESIKDQKGEAAKRFYVWAQIANRHVLRVVGLRSQFYRMASTDPVQAKAIFPGLERRGVVPPADDLQDPLNLLEGQLLTQLMKAVAQQAASNATNRAGGGGGGPANGN